jgi:enoyl-CoA hydratase/carnithine racemase
VKTLVTYETIRLEPAGDAAAGLWLLTLNRPEAMNAMNTQMHRLARGNARACGAR